MAKFINKKEQVYDLRLTAYGRYLISIGQFVPKYYSFYDDNILYDSNYARFPEQQNHTEERILEKTQYLESLVLFEDIDELIDVEETIDFDNIKLTPARLKPRKDIFRLVEPIGDAYLDGESQAAPAWKIVALNGMISSSFHEDLEEKSKIPLVNIDLNYKKVVIDYDVDPDDGRNPVEDPRDIFDVINSTSTFVDSKVIKLRTDNGMIYADEVNTELLTENFDIEVYRNEFVECKKSTLTIVISYDSDSGVQLSDGDSITISDGTDTQTFTWRTTPSADREMSLPPNTGTDKTKAMYALSMLFEFLDSLYPMNFEVGLPVQIGTEEEGGPTSPGPDAMMVLTSNICDKFTGDVIYTNQVPVMAMSDPAWKGGAPGTEKLVKKYFRKDEPQVENGFLISNEPAINTVQNYTTSSVEYYFSILRDSEVPADEACKAAEVYNKTSYFVDLDFDCEKTQEENVFYDIYGIATEPDICETS